MQQIPSPDESISNLQQNSNRGESISSQAPQLGGLGIGSHGMGEVSGDVAEMSSTRDSPLMNGNQAQNHSTEAQQNRPLSTMPEEVDFFIPLFHTS
jgi:hypothetical protein